MKREAGIATAQCRGDAYLDLLNQRLEDSGACVPPSGSPASVGSYRVQPASGPLRFLDFCAGWQLSQRRAVTGQCASRGKSTDGLAELVLREKLGAGAFGSVFKCTWRRRELAVKMYRDDVLGASAAERELELLKHLDTTPESLLICHLQTWQKTSRSGYLLFFKLFRCDLRTLLKCSSDRDASIDARQAMRFTLNLSAALAFVHSRRVIHRDLKPANILIRGVDGSSTQSGSQPAATNEQWHAVIADFGNGAIVQRDRALQGGAEARWAGAGKTLSRMVCTLWYAAPEMLVHGERYDYPVDVWSLGIVLLEIEAKEAALPTRSGVADWEQLRECWRFCQPASAKSGFLYRARQDLARNKVIHLHDVFRVRSLVGQLYGARFREFAFHLLNFEPQKRVVAQTLFESCQRAVQQNLPLPSWWLLEC